MPRSWLCIALPERPHRAYFPWKQPESATIRFVYGRRPHSASAIPQTIANDPGNKSDVLSVL